jgi:hypothetical protein
MWGPASTERGRISGKAREQVTVRHFRSTVEVVDRGSPKLLSALHERGSRSGLVPASVVVRPLR